MKVRLKPAPANRENVRGWLRPDVDYVVLSVEVLGDESAYRIVTEDNATPALFESSLFDVTDESVPGLWVQVSQAHGKPDQRMPRAWSADGFWEAFFDGDPGARRAYARALVDLMAAA